MSKMMLALASFSLGVLTSFAVLSGIQTSTFAQASPPQTAPKTQPIPIPNIVGGAGMPVVPPITQHFIDFGLAVPGMPFGVDGSDCTRCTFNGQAFRYGGGNFQFTEFKFSGPIRVEFVGAARNTLIFIDFINQLAAGQAPPHATVPTGPMIKTAAIKEPISGSISTLE